MIGPAGLAACGVHEIKPAPPRIHPRLRLPRHSEGRADSEAHPPDWSAAWGAARSFALALAARRLTMRVSGRKETRPMLWCQMRGHMDDLGALYAPALQAFGIPANRILIVEVGKETDALWAIEEALKSGSLALVAGMLDEVDLTPARRLALAAKTHATPCLMLTHPQAPAMAAVSTRWRIGPLPSGRNRLSEQAPSRPFLHRLPGPLQLSLGLERNLARSLAAEVSIAHVEWCHETFRFRMAAPVRDRTHDTRPAWRHTA